jgi:pimeloyl-ACP methyl ester carboxylesterase
MTPLPTRQSASSDRFRRRGCRYWFRLLAVGLIGGVLLAYLGFVLLSTEALIRPAHTAICCVTPLDKGRSYEDMQLHTTDGLTLRGWYIPSRNRAVVIMLHGYGGNRLEMLGRAIMLAQHGYGVLLYDERASGESDGEFRTLGWLDANDVPIALAYLQQRSDVDPQRVGILGFSIGGQIVLRAAANSDQITAIVAEEPGLARISDAPNIPTFGDKLSDVAYWIGEQWLSLRTGVPIPAGVVDGLARIAPRPILFIATGQDYGRTLVQHFYQLAHDPKFYWEVPETTHGGSPIARPQEYEQTVVGFFDRTLLK